VVGINSKTEKITLKLQLTNINKIGQINQKDMKGRKHHIKLG